MCVCGVYVMICIMYANCGAGRKRGHGRIEGGMEGRSDKDVLFMYEVFKKIKLVKRKG